MERLFTRERDDIAASQLGVSSDDYTITFGGIEFDVIPETDQVLGSIEGADEMWHYPDKQDVETAMADASVNIELPTHFMLVGMSPIVNGELRKYNPEAPYDGMRWGVIDFTNAAHPYQGNQ